MSNTTTTDVPAAAAALLGDLKRQLAYIGRKLDKVRDAVARTQLAGYDDLAADMKAAEDRLEAAALRCMDQIMRAQLLVGGAR